jgi:hypothetical protein
MAKGKKTGGRVAGTPNKATADVKAVAGQYSAEALSILIDVARTSESDAAKVSAIKEILDRAHGKSPQAIIGSDTDAPIKTIMEIVWAGSSDSGS